MISDDQYLLRNRLFVPLNRVRLVLIPLRLRAVVFARVIAAARLSAFSFATSVRKALSILVRLRARIVYK